MFLFILALIIGLIGVGGILYAIFAKNGEYRPAWGIGGACAAVLAGLMIIFSTVTTVGPSDVAIATAFGKTQGSDLGPGIHFLAPWVNTITWDESVQNISYGRDLNQSHSDHCLQVRIGGQQSVCLALTFQYQVRKPAVDGLFIRYRTQPNMNQRLVVTDLDSAIQTQLQTFSPIEALAANNVNGTSMVPYAKKVETQMRSEIGGDINIVKLLLIYPQFDSATQGRLNQFQTQIADTLIAQQAVKTNAALAQANRELATSASPNVIAQQCVTNVLIPLVKAGMNPQGVNCFGGGGGATVVVPTKGG